MAVRSLFHGLKIRTMPGQQRCGDTALIRVQDECLYLTLIDVLGHGNDAAELADAAHAALSQQQVMMPLDTIVWLHEHFRGSRGMVVSHAVIDPSAGCLTYCGVGNIIARIIGDESHQVVNRDGVVGYRMIPPHEQQYTFTPGYALLMHSDGIRSRIGSDVLATVRSLAPDIVLEQLIHNYGKPSDDASAIIAGISA